MYHISQCSVTRAIDIIFVPSTLSPVGINVFLCILLSTNTSKHTSPPTRPIQIIKNKSLTRRGFSSDHSDVFTQIFVAKLKRHLDVFRSSEM